MFILGQEEDYIMEDTMEEDTGEVVGQRETIKNDILPDLFAMSLCLMEQLLLQDKTLSKYGELEMRVLLHGLKEHD